MEPIFFIFVVIQGFVCGFVSQTIASAKGHDHGSFFWLGFFFSVIGILFAIGVPTRERERSQQASMKPTKPAIAKAPKQADLYLQLEEQVQGPFTQEQVEGFLQVGVRLTLRSGVRS